MSASCCLLVLAIAVQAATQQTAEPNVKGSVEWFNEVKGFGSIARDDGGKEVYVHFSSVACPQGKFCTLAKNEKVLFDVMQGAKGPYAVNVRRNEPW